MKLRKYGDTAYLVYVWSISIFYIITIGAIGIISAASSLVIVVKKIYAYYKDKTTSGNIVALLKSGKGSCPGILNTQMSKYNKPIISASLVTTIVLGIEKFVFSALKKITFENGKILQTMYPSEMRNSYLYIF